MIVAGVNQSATHSFSKDPRQDIILIADMGVSGDVHMGRTGRFPYLRLKSPQSRNLRQIHLLPAELLERIASDGAPLRPGDLGENVTTRGVDLVHLPEGSRLRLGADALIELTGLRTPCGKIEKFRKGLLRQVFSRDSQGKPRPDCGVMGIVLAGGLLRPGDRIQVETPAGPQRPLRRI